MSVPVHVRPEARADIRAAESYLDSQRPGTGGRFVADVLAVLARLGDMPLGYGRVGRGVRAAPVSCYGYVVYYRSDGSAVEVIAVVHGSRDRTAWRGRV